LRHEHTATDLQTDRFTQFNPATAGIGAITVDCFATRTNNIRVNRCGKEQKRENKLFHADNLTQAEA